MPGDLLDGDKLKPGAGTYVSEGKIYAALLGIKSVKSNYVNIIPLSGRYIPGSATVSSQGGGHRASNWLIDINSPFLSLHVNEVPCVSNVS